MNESKEILTKNFDSAKHISSTKRHKKIFLAVLACLVIVAALIGIVAKENSRNKFVETNESHHAIVKSACSSTFYPDLCFSAVAAAAAKKVTRKKDVIRLSLNITASAVEHNFYKIKKLLARKGLTQRGVTALHDCLETINETLDELHQAVEDLHGYPYKKPLTQHADDLKTLISAAMTNQETCLDGFSHKNADKEVRKALIDGEKYVEKMCSNALAMIKNMTDEDIANEMLIKRSNRKLEEEGNGIGWPRWLSTGDRRRLRSSSVIPNVVVVADGSGDYKTVSEAVAKAPVNSRKRYIIRIKAGVYRENVEIPSNKTNIMFIGDGRSRTVITGERNVVDGSTTFRSATVAVAGEGFLARDITFENTAGPSKHQAVALRVSADLTAFYQCNMIAYQDTLYVHSQRQFFVNCLITGTVDFIFGNAAAVFQNCDIRARRPHRGQKNMVTAQGRTDRNQNTGIVFQKCRIGATSDLQTVKNKFPTYLGRPWKEYSRTVILQSDISDVIQPAGWHDWNGSFALKTLFYGEYQNTGASAGTHARVKWDGHKVITNESEAQSYTAGEFISGGSWLYSTGFPFSLDL
ncbi:hypothetical protein Golob_003486 [Gossypium lobatum]|uniref:Pectinesterase n=1 Tax=Gossypium lobatum TaxID=34289 RepID=A0A7J8MYF1_9ROSI|nr:hypothetical protein [Gossypium lobatum]